MNWPNRLSLLRVGLVPLIVLMIFIVIITAINFIAQKKWVHY